MLIARQKLNENIAEYVLYMFQIEDLIRAYDFDLEGIIVVNTKNTVAIFPKDKNGKLKEYLKMLEEKGLDKYL